MKWKLSNHYGFVVSSSSIPQGDEGSICIVVKLNKNEWGERGARLRAKAFKNPNWPNLDMIFCKKNLLLVANFRPKIKSNITRVSKLKTL